MHRRRPRRFRWSIPVGLVFLCVAAPRLARAQGGDYSRNCPKDLDRKGKLMPGSFDGDFDGKLFLKGDDKALGMELTLWFHGKLHVEARGDGLAADGTIADAEYWLGGAGKKEKGPLDVMGGMSFTGQGRLGFETAGAEEFDVAGPLDVAGGIVAGVEDREGPQDSHAKHEGSSSGEARVKFKIVSAGCRGAQGTFTSALLSDSQASFASKGFTVTLQPATWRVGTSSSSEEEDEFRKKLERVPKGIVNRLEVEVERLSGLADEAKSRQKPMDECLMAIWVGHVRRRLSERLEERTKKLASYRASAPRRCDPFAPNGCSAGDTAGLDDRVRAVFEVDRALAMVGLDTCDERIHTKAFDAIERKMKERLEYLLRVGAAPEDLLAVFRNARLVGAVSPELNSETMMAISRHVEQKAEVCYANYRTVRAAKGKDDCDPQVREAARIALAAAKQCQVVGASCGQAMSPDEALSIRKRCGAASSRPPAR